MPKRSNLCKSIEIRVQMLEDSKQTCYTEYLISLRLLHKYILQTKFENTIREGDSSHKKISMQTSTLEAWKDCFLVTRS